MKKPSWIFIFALLFQMITAAALPVQGNANPGQPKYGWVLKEVVQYDKLPPGSENYSCVRDGNSYLLGYKIDQEEFVVSYSWSTPPSVILPDQKVNLDINGAVTLNKNMNHSVNTEMSVFFDRVDIEPGAYGGGPVFADETGNGAIRFGYKESEGKEVALKVTASPGQNRFSGNQMAIIVALYNGRSSGTKYIYEWKLSVTQNANNKVAAPTKSSVMVDGQKIGFEAYNIDGSNYFMLRDLAMALKDSQKKFEVGWDGANNAIKLTTNKANVPAGGELKVSANPAKKEAKPTSSKIYLNGKEVSLTAYNINGNNYFKLRDIAKLINFGIVWDSKTNAIGIDTSLVYTE